MPTVSTTSQPRQLRSRRAPPASRPPRAAHAAATPCALSSRGRSEGEAHSLLFPRQSPSAGHRAPPMHASKPCQAGHRATVLRKDPLKHRVRHLRHLSRPPSHRAPPPATDVLLRHRSDLRPSSPSLREPRAGALNLFSDMPSPVPHHRLAAPPRACHGEPLRCLCPKSGPSPLGLAPWHLLPHPLAAGRPD
jgi:hypothetical protein